MYGRERLSRPWLGSRPSRLPGVARITQGTERTDLIQTENIGPSEVVDHAPLGALGQLWMLLRCFRNWPTVGARLALSVLTKRPPGRRPLYLRTRAGPVLTVPPGDGAWCTVVEVFGRDAYRLGAMEITTRAPVFIDVGANIGAFALDVCLRWPSARVVCLEPAPGAFAHLTSNLRANGCTTRVKAIAAAVTGDPAASIMSLFERPSDSCTSTTVEAFAHTPARPPGRWLRVPAVWMDHVLASFEGGVDCLKMDVEGAEYDIVRGTRLETLRQLRHVVLEYHPVPERELAELVERFAQAGLVWKRWERSPELGRGVCWFAASSGAA